MSEGTSFLLLGLLAVAVGLAGWLMPERWNLLRLKRAFARPLSKRANALVPKIVASILLILGVGLTAAGWQIRREDSATTAPTPPAEASRLPDSIRTEVAVADAAVAEASAAATSGSLEMKLFKAIRAGHRTELERLLAEGANPNALSGGDPPYHDYTPVLTAIEYGETRVVPLLLDAGADIDGRGWGGSTPLIYAIVAKENELVRVLIARGADVNAREPDEGLTPLTAALAYGDAALVPELLRAGADPNIQNNDGHNALDWVEEGAPEMRRLLLEAGAIDDG